MKKSFILICFLVIGTTLFCQRPLLPEVISVSIIPFTNPTQVTIKWKPSKSSPIDGYSLYEHHFNPDLAQSPDPFSELEFQHVGPLIYTSTFDYSSVRKQPIMFWVAGYNNTYGNSLYGNYYHRTIFTQCSYDSCNMNVTIRWTKYIGWGSNLNKYNVSEGMANNLVADSISPNDTILTISVEPNKNYCFYVSAINKDATITSLSNDTCIFTKSANAPQFINANNASFNQNSTGPVKLKFTIDPAAQTKKYQLYVSNNPEDGYVPLNDPYTATSDSVIILDNSNSSSTHYYRLDAINYCGHSSTRSNIATAIVPKYTVQSNVVNLTWDDYKGWNQGVSQYYIYRTIGSGNPQIIDSTTTNHFSDNLSSLVGLQFSGEICYYVEALSNQNNLGKTYRSRSSVICTDLSKAVFIPDGFTPNGDLINDIFRPSFPFSPKEYVMVVYDRYGFKVFEVKQQFQGLSNIDVKGWDGTMGSGQKAPEGAYVYFIKFISQTGQTVERKGTFSLIYP